MPSTQSQLPTYEEMIKVGMHFGRKKTVLDPRMKPYIHTVKDSIHIIDLVKTQEALEKAIKAMGEIIDSGRTILFVGLTPNSVEPIMRIAADLKMPHVVKRWLGGTFTNFKTIISRVKHLEEMEQERDSGGFEKYIKHERGKKEKEIVKLKEKFEGLRTMNKIPDMVFVSSAKKSDLAIKEALKMKVKIVGIINTDSDPLKIDYPIPANDNSKQSVGLIINTIGEALKARGTQRDAQ